MQSKNSEDCLEVDWRQFGFSHVAGIDEVGRGCLAGPVFAAAVVLCPDFDCSGITDSKLIAPEKRMVLAERIKSLSLDWSIGVGSLEEIEKLNILQASLLAMKRAVECLKIKPELLLIDGNQKITGSWNQITIVKGDLRCKPIGAASILAKVSRDQLMLELDRKYPGYFFGEHKGYPTPTHRNAIKNLGPSPIHRRSFSGVREFLGHTSY